MMSKVLFAVAVMAVQMSGLVSATACGWFNEVCCDIPDNNPNIGTCKEARNVCWEGKCMKCGTNGMIKCPSHPECDDGYVVNKDGWCSNAPGHPGPPPDFSCKSGCGHEEVCNPWGQCEPCGKNGQRKCAGERGCEEGTTANADDFCATNPHCGWFNEACCPGSQCFEGKCTDGKCVAAPVVVTPPVVITPPVDTSACGDLDWPCCNEAQRSFLKTDDSCSKTASGVCCDGVCKSGSCPAPAVDPPSKKKSGGFVWKKKSHKGIWKRW